MDGLLEHLKKFGRPSGRVKKLGFSKLALADLDGNGFDDLILPNGMECIER